MRVKGKVWKEQNEKYWSVEIPALNILTQGKSERDAQRMGADAAGLLLQVHTKDKASLKDLKIVPGSDGEFSLICENTVALVSLIIRRMREKDGLSAAEVADRIGGFSKQSLNQYEHGKHSPSVTKLDEILGALGLDLELTIINRSTNKPVEVLDDDDKEEIKKAANN